MSPSRSRQAQRCGEEARARPGTTAARRKPAPARAKGRRGRRRRGIPPLLWAGALVGLLAIVAVVLARPGADRSDQGARHRESGEVTVSGEQLPVLSQAGTDPAVGRRAPALSGTDFEGRPVATAASGKPQVVILLAHWCPHCRNEVPRITSWLRQAGTPAGVSLVSVSTGTDNARPNYPPSAWLGRERWPLPVVVDDTSGTAAKAYGLSGFPFFVFIDADGTVAGRYAGELDVEDLQARIQSLRASEPATASTSAAAPPLVDVTMGEMWFKASRVQVPAGRPVRLRFRNAGKVAHQALVGTQAEQDAAEARGGEGGPAGRTITLGPGETGELVVTVPRGTTLLLGCHLPGHWPAGMRGSVFGT